MANTVKFNPTMTTSAINKKLANGGSFIFTKGTYNLTDTLILCSNTTVACEAGVKFIKKTPKAMLQTKVSATTTKYNGAHDISWDGGEFDGKQNSTASNLVNIIHAKNVMFHGTVFTNVRHLHFIEVNASKNIGIVDCFFGGHITKKGKEYKEAIQYDFAYYGGLDYAPKGSKCYDGTHCDGLIVDTCSFVDCDDCIGTHTETTLAKSHKNFTIVNNIFTMAKDKPDRKCVKLVNVNGASIGKNMVVNTASPGSPLLYLNGKVSGYDLDGNKVDIINQTCKKISVYC